MHIAKTIDPGCTAGAYSFCICQLDLPMDTGDDVRQDQLGDCQWFGGCICFSGMNRFVDIDAN